MLLGVISPKIKTTTVITIVETVAAFSIFGRRSLTKRRVPSVASAILTILFPMRMVEISLS